jgi:hypothetical protein
MNTNDANTIIVPLSEDVFFYISLILVSFLPFVFLSDLVSKFQEKLMLSQFSDHKDF